MRTRVLMLLAVLAATAIAGYVASERVRARRSAAMPASPAERPTMAANPGSEPLSVRATAAPSYERTIGAARTAAGSSPRAAITPQAGSSAAAPAAGAAASKARRLAAREPYARDDLRRLFERVLAGKLRDRELGPQDYERLVDAALRLRAALRVLRGTEESAATAAVREEQRQAVGEILGEIEAITGLPPAELGSVLTPEDGETGDDSAGGAIE